MSGIATDPPSWMSLSEEERSSAMRRCLPLAVAFERAVYRGSAPSYATEDDLLTGEGSRKVGGRWNPLKSFPAVYVSLDPETALSECHAYCRYFGWPDEAAYPITLVAVAMRLGRVLDLSRAGPAHEALGINRDTIRGVDWRREQDSGREALTQSIGRVARAVGFEGLLVPSAASVGGLNLVYFPDRLLPGSAPTILKPEKLTKRP